MLKSKQQKLKDFHGFKVINKEIQAANMQKQFALADNKERQRQEAEARIRSVRLMRRAKRRHLKKLGLNELP